MNEKIQRVYAYLREQLTEASTLRGVLVLVSLGGGWLANLPIDATLSVAVVIGAVLKLILPDKLK